jgi:two-component sensor histidine kinase
LKEFEGRFAARLQALADIQDFMVKGDWRGCAVRELAVSQLAHCGDLMNYRIRLTGEPVSLDASACQYVGMAFHELCTNALKYGALSNDTGMVTLRWTLTPAEHAETLTIEWIESGGPPVIEPARQGFGHKVTTDIIARALDADVSEEFREEGLRWRLVMPARHLARQYLRAN